MCIRDSYSLDTLLSMLLILVGFQKVFGFVAFFGFKPYCYCYNYYYLLRPSAGKSFTAFQSRTLLDSVETCQRASSALKTIEKHTASAACDPTACPRSRQVKQGMEDHTTLSKITTQKMTECTWASSLERRQFAGARASITRSSGRSLVRAATRRK